VSVVGVLLAGGASTRFGSDKLLHPLADGTPIAVASLRNLRAALPRIVAVVRPGADALAHLLCEDGAEVAVCDRADDGMGRTLAHAVGASRDATGWVVALADMPFIRPDTIRRVAARLEAGAALVAPRYAGERGHPVGFAARFGAALGELTGDAGARDLLRAESGALELIDCDDPGVVHDVDTPADLAGRAPEER